MQIQDQFVEIADHSVVLMNRPRLTTFTSGHNN